MNSYSHLKKFRRKPKNSRKKLAQLILNIGSLGENPEAHQRSVEAHERTEESLRVRQKLLREMRKFIKRP
jgi:hypothetical protein